MAKTIAITFILIALAIVAMGVKALFVKGGKFPSGHAHEIEGRRREAINNAALRKKEKSKH